MVLSSKLTPSKPNYLVLHQQSPKPLFTHVNMVNAAYNVHATCAHQAMNLAAATVHALPVKNVINSAKNIKLDWTEHIPAVTHLLFLSTIKIWMRMEEQKTLIELIKGGKGRKFIMVPHVHFARKSLQIQQSGNTMKKRSIFWTKSLLNVVNVQDHLQAW
jgi:hypothetical protein